MTSISMAYVYPFFFWVGEGGGVGEGQVDFCLNLKVLKENVWTSIHIYT